MKTKQQKNNAALRFFLAFASLFVVTIAMTFAAGYLLNDYIGIQFYEALICGAFFGIISFVSIIRTIKS